MAQLISNAFVTLFDAEVKQAYQASRALAGLVRERNGVEGSVNGINPLVSILVVRRHNKNRIHYFSLCLGSL